MRAGWLVLLLAGSVGCAAPTLTRDGQLVFTPGAKGAVVLTANGVEIHDRADVPTPVPRTSPYEAWQPATGFLLPESSLWRRTSRPLELHEQGVDVVVRASDEYSPSWGGDGFLRVELASHVPSAPARSVVVIIDDDDLERAEETLRLVQARLRAADALTVVDARGSKVVLPAVRAADETLAEASLATRFVKRATQRRDVVAAIRQGRALAGGRPTAFVLASDRTTDEADGELAAMIADGVHVVAMVTREGKREVASCSIRTPEARASFDGAMDAALGAVPPVALGDVTFRISSFPAPARVLEATRGDVETTLDDDAVHLGDLRAGEGRSEVLRVVLPRSVPGELLDLRFAIDFVDAATGEPRTVRGDLPIRYTDDVSALADERNVDVVADASAMALVGRMSRGALGSSAHFDGIQRVLDVARRSLARIETPRTATERRILDALEEPLFRGRGLDLADRVGRPLRAGHDVRRVLAAPGRFDRATVVGLSDLGRGHVGRRAGPIGRGVPARGAEVIASRHAAGEEGDGENRRREEARPKHRAPRYVSVAAPGKAHQR